MVERGLHLVAPMTDDELRQAIDGPAGRAGLRLEPGLIELLLREVEGEAGALPLLSHALAETWSRREGAVLTVEGYRSTGGIRGAVAQTAEQLWESLTPAQRTSARSLLLRMVALSPDGEPAAARLPLSVAAPDLERKRLVALLSRCRLVTTDDRSVTVAHESVVRAWPRLRSWLDEDAAGQRMLRHLLVAAEDWDGRGRPDSELYRGARLAATTEWRARTSPELTAVEADFLDASAALAQAEEQTVRERARAQARQNRRLRVALAGTALGLVLALVAGVVAVEQSRDQARTARTALVDELVAQSVALRSTRRDLAALLAVEAYRLRPDAATRGALFGVFTATPGFLGYLTTGRGTGHRAGVPLSSGHVLSDGRTLLAAGVDGVIRVIDLERGWDGDRFAAPDVPPIRALISVSRDESTVAEISWEGPEEGGGRSTLGVFDVASRSRRFPDVRLPMDVGAVAVSADGRYVAVSGYDDGRVLVFDTKDVSQLPSLDTVESDGPGVVRLPPVGPAALLDSVRDYSEGRRAAPLPGALATEGKRHTAALAFRGDGLLVVGSEVGIVRVVDPRNGREVSRLTGAPRLTSNNAAALSSDGSVLVTSGSRGLVRWDVRRGRPMWATPVGEQECATSVIHLSARSVLCGGRSSRVVTFDLDSGTRTPAQFDLQRGDLSALVMTPDQGTLVELSRTQPVLGRWALDGTGPITRRLPVRGAASGYDSSGRLLLLSGPETFRGIYARRTVNRVVEARSGEEIYRDDRYLTPVWTTRAGELAAWTENGPGALIDVRTDARKPLEGGFGQQPNGASVARKADVVLAWGNEAQESAYAGIWVTWDLATGETRHAALIPRGVEASLTPDGRVFAWRSGQHLSTVEVATRKRLAERSGVVTAAFSPTGALVASTADGKVVLLSARTLRRVGRPLPGVSGELAQLAFSGDGAWLAVRASDGSVRLVDLPTSTPVGEPIQVGVGPERRVALRPDGRELAVSTGSGLSFWDLRVSRWRAEACRLAGRDLTREEWATYLAAIGDYRRTCTWSVSG
jgi:WD40 repeat protein